MVTLSFLSPQHEAAGIKIKGKQNYKTAAATVPYSMTIVLWKGDNTFPI